MKNLLLTFAFFLSCITSCTESSSPTLTSSTPQTYPVLEGDAVIQAQLSELSNWNRWGPSDEKGTVNFVTPEKVIQAARLIKTGQTVSLARQTSIAETEGVREGKYEMQRGKYGSRDYVGAVWHGFAVTHLDGLCHVFADTTQMYNGYPVDHLTAKGAEKLGLEKLATEGIVGRGILIDAGQFLELELGQALMPEDLDKVLAKEGVDMQSGDILFVRTGFGSANTRTKRTGLHPSCIAWARDKEISLLGSDGDNDPHPIPFQRWASPFHTIGIPYLGLPLIDNADLDSLSQLCRKENRYSFFVTIAPWRLQGTTSCPINPIAIF